MCCSNVKVTAKTGLKCICVYIHPGLNSCRSEFMLVWIHAGLKSYRSEVSWLGPAGGMTWDQSELFSSRSHVNNTSVINYTLTDTKWSRFDFVPVSCKRGLVVKYPLVLFHQIPSIYRVSQKNVPSVVR
jgi:hypothetical protein